MSEKSIYVTRPSLPPLEEFIPYLEKIWDNRVLTNGGPFHEEFEKALADFLGVKYVSLFCNGTLALVTALQALKVEGEVITTPYSFVATSHALKWNGIRPVFVDIDPETFNIDAEKIESAITKRTTAILPVHCYGRPCEFDKIQAIADKYNLKVIYDAAHAFSVSDSQGSILRYGDMSILSFHATKVFNTFEGGAIISNDYETKQHVDYLKNFGFVDEVTVVESGINGKMNEMQSALGLLQLSYITKLIDQRKQVDSLYRDSLKSITGVLVPNISLNVKHNYSYFPILLEEEFRVTRDCLYQELRDSDVFARRYFYPLISDFVMYEEDSLKSSLSVAMRVSEKVLCLPIYPDLKFTEIEKIVKIIKG